MASHTRAWWHEEFVSCGPVQRAEIPHVRSRAMDIALRRVTFALLPSLLCGCASTTLQTKVCVVREQLIVVHAASTNAYLARQYARDIELERQKGTLNADTAINARVQRVSDAVIRQVGVFRPEASKWAWEVNVVTEDDVVDAFCLSGGKIVVKSGAVNKLALTDGELAALIGHEIAHALREHTLEIASRSGLMQLPGALAQIRTLGVAGGIDDRYDAPWLRSLKLQTEIEADIIAVELVQRAGFDPQSVSSLIDKLEAHRRAQPRAPADHPTYEARRTAIRTSIAAVLAPACGTNCCPKGAR